LKNGGENDKKFPISPPEITLYVVKVAIREVFSRRPAVKRNKNNDFHRQKVTK